MRTLLPWVVVGLLALSPAAAAAVGTDSGTALSLADGTSDLLLETNATAGGATPGDDTLAGTSPDALALDEATLDESGGDDLEVDDLPAAGASVARVVLVGVAPGRTAEAVAPIQSAGGIVQARNDALGVLRVEATDVGRLEEALSSIAGFEYVEDEDEARIEGAQWNGAQWNGAQWNGAQWNGARWNDDTGAPSTVDDPGRRIQWGLPATETPRAWKSHMGERHAQVCVVDSGIAWDHPDLAANMWTGPEGGHGYNAIDATRDAYDDAGHGTHVAGIAAAEVGNGVGLAGIGNLQLMAVKALGADGSGREGDVAFGIEWCATHGAEVVLLALHVTKWGPTMARAVEYALAQDTLLVASAGNGGPCGECVSWPARHEDVMGVGAVAPTLAAGSFSSTGAQVDLVAPGVEIASTFLDDSYAYGSGTSQAAAHVAGAAALLRDAHPELSARATWEALTSTASELGPAGRDPTFGSGLLDTHAALRAGGA